jgi:hypothetical protein
VIGTAIKALGDRRRRSRAQRQKLIVAFLVARAKRSSKELPSYVPGCRHTFARTLKNARGRLVLCQQLA